MYYKANELLVYTFGAEEKLGDLNEFYFAHREWKGQHDSILDCARSIDLHGLHAAEGGFDFPTREDRYCDARYGGIGKPIMKLWCNGLHTGYMWALRVIFRMHKIATFDSEAEATEYLKVKIGIA